MALAPGTRFGSFEISSVLGAGGMGEVYRARDTKLDRDVALKILPERFAHDAERLARFEREAKTLASLNHPHIAQLHGFEESAGTRALVMELVEGDDLAQRIARGPIPVDEARAIAQQIAEAVEAAHEVGIVHRDLKPANIKLRADGTVKVLDFGLARPGAPDASDAIARDALANSPTITSPAALTMGGVILGTAAYMSPEQAKGKAVDKRSDIWAFGCVLYEMLTARRPFPGEDISDTLAAVLTKEVDWSALPPQTPAGIRTLLGRCLQRNPKERLRDIGDARWLLHDATVPSDSAPVETHDRRRPALLPWAVAAVAAAVAVALGAIAWSRPPVSANGTTRFVIATGPGEFPENPVVAPDGSFVVFQGDRLYVRTLSEFEARPLPGTEQGSMPFLSPDGRWVGFYAGGKLKKVSVAGGDPIIVGDVENDSPGAAWGPGNRIFFTPAWVGSPLMAVSADGGPVAAVSTLDPARKERGHWWPEPLPDGRHVLFTIWPAGAGLAESQIAVLDLQTGQHRWLFPGALARYAAGHLVFFRAGVYQAVGFNPDTVAVTGEPRVVLADALALNPMGDNDKSVGLSASGSLAYVARELNPEITVFWMSRDGKQEATPLKFRYDGGAFLSPDGTRLAFARPQNGGSQIAVYDLVRHHEQRLQSPGYNFHPAWHPDGQRIGFTSMRKGDFDVRVESIGGAAAEDLLAEMIDEELVGWLPGAQGYVARLWTVNGPDSVVLVDTRSKARTPLITGSIDKGPVHLSPDGRWLALCASTGGAPQIYVRSLAAQGGLQPVAACTGGYRGMEWSTATRELLYVRGTELIAAAYVDRDGLFTVQKDQVVARMLEDDALLGVSPDGKRFLIGRRVNQESKSGGIRVVVNGLEAITNSSR